MAGENFDRKILVNGDGILSTSEARVSFGDLYRVKLTISNRAFLENRHELKLDEYDVTNGTKLRTIVLKGVPLERRHMVASVLSNGIEVFCIVTGRPGIQSFIQSFLL